MHRYSLAVTDSMAACSLSDSWDIAVDLHAAAESMALTYSFIVS